MIGFIKKHKLLLILTVLIIGIVIAYLQIKNKEQKQDTNISPTPTPIVFELINTFPSEGEQEGNPFLALQFTFSTPVDPSSPDIQITPKIETTVSTNIENNTLIIKPEPRWDYGVKYTIRISNIKSLDGQSLDSPITRSFTFNPITDSPLVE